VFLSRITPPAQGLTHSSLVSLDAQAVFSVWNLLAFTTAPLEQAALAYIPAAASLAERRTTLQLLGGVSAAIGVTCGLLAAGVPLLAPQLLTRDTAVWEHMAKIAPLAMVAMVLAAADVGAAGVLLAQRDYGYVARAFVVTLLLLAAFVGLVVRGPGGWGLSGVWVGLVLFFSLRCVQSVGRLLWLRHTQQHYQGHHHQPQPSEPGSGWPDAAAAPQLGS
jgi:Na+-driven multidrug efflux pump